MKQWCLFYCQVLFQVMMLHLFQKDFMPECDYSTSIIATGCCVIIRSAFRALMVHVLIFKLKQGMIHVLRCHFIAVFSKSSLAYTCIDWPTPLSSQTSLSRVCGRRVADVDGCMLLKDGTLCTRFRSISRVVVFILSNPADRYFWAWWLLQQLLGLFNIQKN